MRNLLNSDISNDLELPII